MLRRPQNLTPHFRPIDTLIQLLIYPSAHRHAIPSYDVKAQGYFLARNFFLTRPDDAFDGVLEDEIHAAVTGKEGPDHGTAVDCEDGYFF